MDKGSVGTALPEAFLNRMQRLLGDEYASFLVAYSQPPASGIRVNTLKISVEEFRSLFPASLTPIPWCSSGFFLSSGGHFGKHPLHAAGLYYLQDPSAMAVAELLAPKPGERVLDLAAAPGGKTTHLAALMENQGLLVANEIHPKRVWELAENLERCGVTNAVVLNETPSRLAEHFGAYFHRVLVDAPCSGEGMFRKSETARAEWSPGLVHMCAARQSTILNSAACLTAPGGLLAYTTCTFAPEENEAVVWRFLSEHPEFELIQTRHAPGFTPGRPAWARLFSSREETFSDQTKDHLLQRTVRLWPHLGGPEGHFIALMQRQDSPTQSDRRPRRRIRSERLPSGMVHALNAFWRDTLILPPPAERLTRQGLYLYQLPDPPPPDLTGLKIIHPGWWLGRMQNRRFIPSHALAMALKTEEVRRWISLSNEEAITYLRGEPLQAEGEEGWLLTTVRAGTKHYPLGWGRRVRSVVKNAYPKGLRWSG